MINNLVYYSNCTGCPIFDTCRVSCLFGKNGFLMSYLRRRNIDHLSLGSHNFLLKDYSKNHSYSKSYQPYSIVLHLQKYSQPVNKLAQPTLRPWKITLFPYSTIYCKSLHCNKSNVACSTLVFSIFFVEKFNEVLFYSGNS